MGIRSGLTGLGQFLASKATVRGVIALCFTVFIPLFAFAGFDSLAVAMVVAITGFYFDAKRENGNGAEKRATSSIPKTKKDDE